MKSIKRRSSRKICSVESDENIALLEEAAFLSARLVAISSLLKDKKFSARVIREHCYSSIPSNRSANKLAEPDPRQLFLWHVV
jgi:hypothetical protein